MNLKLWLALGCMVFHATACTDTSKAHIDLSGLNYTNVAISGFSVDGYGGGGISANGGGGSFVCCIILPDEWRPDMKVTVRWTEDGQREGPRKERVVAVPKYTKHDIGFFAVHFYPGDVVKVLVTTIVVGHPNYPYPRPK